jgi:hypothetical protein
VTTQFYSSLAAVQASAALALGGKQQRDIVVFDPQVVNTQRAKLVAAIDYWVGDPLALQHALVAVDDITTLVNVLAEAGVITDNAADALNERLNLIRSALRRYDSPWGPVP